MILFLSLFFYVSIISSKANKKRSILLNASKQNNYQSGNLKTFQINKDKYNIRKTNEITNSSFITLNKTINYNIDNINLNNIVQKKNLIIGAITKYNWDIIGTFFRSFKLAGFENTECVIFYDDISHFTIDKMISLGITVLKIPNKFKDEKITYSKWKIYENFLNENKYEYNLVLTTDLRKSFFQLDVFKFYDTQKSFLGVAVENGILNNVINHNWIIGKYTEESYSTIRNESIIDGRTIWGTLDKFMDFSKLMWENLNVLLDVENNEIEQVIANNIIYKDKLFNDCLIKSDNKEGRIMTMALAKKENIRFDLENNVLNGNGEIAAVINQYELHQDIIEKMKDKFCSKINVLVLGFDKYLSNQSLSKTSFSFYLIPINSRIYAKSLSFSVNIKYQENIFLKDVIEYKEDKVFTKCERKLKYIENKVEFLCEFNYKENIIKNIEMIKNFMLIAQDIIIKGYTPMALKKINNIQNVEKEEIFNKKIYVLENAIKIEKDYGFNITGKLYNKDFLYNNISVIIVVFDKKNENEKRIDCYLEKHIDIVSLICKPKENIITNLYGAIADLKNEILVIEFKNGQNSTIDFRYNNTRTIFLKINKKTKKIILYSIFEIIIVISILIIYYLIYIIKSKLKNKEHINNEKNQIQLSKGIKRKTIIKKRNKTIKKRTKNTEKEKEKVKEKEEEEESYPLNKI
jgi:hypothetical protein